MTRTYIEYKIRHNMLDVIAIILILLSSGTLMFFYEHSAFMCIITFLYGIYFCARKNCFSSLFKTQTSKFVILFTFWIWINYLFINTNHAESPEQPFVYTLLIWSTLFMCSSMDFYLYKSLLLKILAFICFVSIIIYFFNIVGVIPGNVIHSHVGDVRVILFDSLWGDRMSSLWWEPSAYQVVLCLTLLIYIPDIIKRKISNKEKYYITVLVISVLLSQATSGYIGLIIIIGIISFYRIGFKHLFKSILIFSLSAIAVFIIYNSSIVQNKLSEDYGTNVEAGSLNMRYSDNMAMWQMAIERPIFGYGLNSQEYLRRSMILNNWTASNGVLDWCAKFGFPFVLIYIYFSFGSLKRKNLVINGFIALFIFLFVNSFNGMVMYPFVWSIFMDYKSYNRLNGEL